MSDVSIEMVYSTHKMMADNTARVILDLGEKETRQVLFLLAEGALEKGTVLKVTLVDECHVDK